MTRPIPVAAPFEGMGLRPLGCCDCGFESLLGHICLSLLSVVCCQVEVSASAWSLVQRGPTECEVSECDREASLRKRLWSTRGCCCMKRVIYYVTNNLDLFPGKGSHCLPSPPPLNRLWNPQTLLPYLGIPTRNHSSLNFVVQAFSYIFF
jgi:hypothetical protein